MCSGASSPLWFSRAFPQVNPLPAGAHFGFRHRLVVGRGAQRQSAGDFDQHDAPYRTLGTLLAVEGDDAVEEVAAVEDGSGAFEAIAEAAERVHDVDL